MFTYWYSVYSSEHYIEIVIKYTELDIHTYRTNDYRYRISVITANFIIAKLSAHKFIACVSLPTTELTLLPVRFSEPQDTLCEEALGTPEGGWFSLFSCLTKCTPSVKYSNNNKVITELRDKLKNSLCDA